MAMFDAVCSKAESVKGCVYEEEDDCEWTLTIIAVPHQGKENEKADV